MPITYKKTVAIFKDVCEIEEAETLLEWCLEHRKGKLNLKDMSHPHAAILQVIMALRPLVSRWPEDEAILEWLMPLLQKDTATAAH